MFRLKRLNVEKVVDSTYKRDLLIADGFQLVEDAEPEPPSNEEKNALEGMTAEELMAYAVEKGVDIGKATSVEGIIRKITEALQEAIGGDDNGDDKTGKVENPTGDNEQ